MPESPTPPPAPDVAVYLLRLLREDTTGGSYDVEIAILDELASDLLGGVEFGKTDDVRTRAGEAIAAVEQLRAALLAVDAAA